MGVLIELIDLEDEQERQSWGQWYDSTYLAQRARLPGVLAARRGERASGSVQNIVVYDLHDVTAPLTQSWEQLNRRLAASEPAPVRAGQPRVEATLYRQILSTVETYQPPEAECLHGAFFEVDLADHDEFNDWYNTEHVLFVDIIDGYLNCRRFQSVTDPTKFLALYDVTNVDIAESKETAAANESPWSDRVRKKLVTYRERRLFRMAHTEYGG